MAAACSAREPGAPPLVSSAGSGLGCASPDSRDAVLSAGRQRQQPSSLACRVPGCPALLSSSYSRKHRICEEHCAAPAVDIGEAELARFCQQCGRMHAVHAFEGARRSCRGSLQRSMQRRKRRQREVEDGNWGEEEQRWEAAALRSKRRQRLQQGGQQEAQQGGQQEAQQGGQQEAQRLPAPAACWREAPAPPSPGLAAATPAPHSPPLPVPGESTAPTQTGLSATPASTLIVQPSQSAGGLAAVLQSISSLQQPRGQLLLQPQAQPQVQPQRQPQVGCAVQWQQGQQMQPEVAAAKLVPLLADLATVLTQLPADLAQLLLELPAELVGVLVQLLQGVQAATISHSSDNFSGSAWQANTPPVQQQSLELPSCCSWQATCKPQGVEAAAQAALLVRALSQQRWCSSGMAGRQAHQASAASTAATSWQQGGGIAATLSLA